MKDAAQERLPSITMRMTGDGLRAFVDSMMGPEGNTSGLRPYGRNIVVKMDEVAVSYAVGGTANELHYADETVIKHNHGSASGCIVAMGSEAFTRYENGLEWKGDRPKVGDRVEVVQYSGKIASGKDGHTYRLMDQNCVLAGIEVDEGQGVLTEEDDAAAAQPWKRPN